MPTVIVKPMSKPSPRDRMIRSAALLMRERGVEATSFTEVLARSSAPRGSIYHHFPGGKAELVVEATRYAGDYIAASMIAAHERGDPEAALRGFGAWWHRVLSESGFEAGCPVVAATLEGERLPAARDAAADAFRAWESIFAAALERSGAEPDRARSLGTLMIAALEGAIILARAERSMAPLSRVVEELIATVRDALPARVAEVAPGLAEVDHVAGGTEGAD